MKANRMKKGRVTVLMDGMKWYQAIRGIKIRNEIRKSAKLTITELAGMMRRGK
jgi:hypothetical protein